jgi:hypothetical protein
MARMSETFGEELRIEGQVRAMPITEKKVWRLPSRESLAGLRTAGSELARVAIFGTGMGLVVDAVTGRESVLTHSPVLSALELGMGVTVAYFTSSNYAVSLSPRGDRTLQRS